jgi:hypothetical protein
MSFFRSFLPRTAPEALRKPEYQLSQQIRTHRWFDRWIELRKIHQSHLRLLSWN